MACLYACCLFLFFLYAVILAIVVEWGICLFCAMVLPIKVRRPEVADMISAMILSNVVIFGVGTGGGVCATGGIFDAGIIGAGMFVVVLIGRNLRTLVSSPSASCSVLRF